MIKPEQVLVACVIENHEPYLREAEYLFKSLRLFGGNLAHAQAVAYFVKSADPRIAESLAELNVVIKVVEPLDERCPHANKIQMLDSDEEFDYLIALDTDIVIVRDFSSYLTGSAIKAKPVDGDPLTMAQWKTLFQYFGLELPLTRYMTSFTFTETIPYFNSGVLLIPREYITVLYEEWSSFVVKLLSAYSELPDIAKHSFFTDQFALSLALTKGRIPHQALPLEMNFPTHHPVHPVWEPDKLSPFLLHYHHRFSAKWEILPCPYENINRLIDEINYHLKRSNKEIIPDHLVQKYTEGFDNRQFWEARYSTNLELGSGIGSRGQHLQYKRELLSYILRDYCPRSVLDVGCGDLEVVKDFSFESYIGIDISPSIIARNRALKPQWTFIAGDFLDIIQRMPLKADLVICFDVLIHQHSYKIYSEFVRALVEASEKIGIISGFETPPRSKFMSEITAYHEPITRTLRRIGITDRNMKIIGAYRDTCILLFNKNEAV